VPTRLGRLLGARPAAPEARDVPDPELVYQPVCAPGGGVTAIEALLPGGDAGAGVEAGARVLRTALTEAAAWRSHVRGVRLAVNLTLRQLIDPGVAGLVRAESARAGFPASDLDVEISEAALRGADAPAVADSIDSLRAAGVKITVDDVRDADQAMPVLGRYAVDALKIHAEVVRGVATDPRAATAVRDLVRVARRSGVRCVAEGVETAADWALLTVLGCDGVQGYVAGSPLPAARIWDAVEQWNGGRPRDAAA
jgi:EAL domain-containing protein (putative c-di-GMP-specific phosphodiesterase class I)